ncbi:MAG: cytoskeleton protein RodZ [Desulfonauticus sp.]|jgi:cytoskeleton protein RodZ|nr:cytoskeleton protein RodZ [Desulfonauticus sp.]
MTLKEIGQILQEARQSKNLDLKDIHDNIKVSIYILKAIEEGNENILPHPVYTKSFIQSYARFLGLDWKKIGEEYASIYELNNKIEDIDSLPTTVKQERKNFWLIAIIVLILLFILVLGIKSLIKNSSDKEIEQSSLSQQETLSQNTNVVKGSNIVSKNNSIQELKREDNKDNNEKEEKNIIAQNKNNTSVNSSIVLPKLEDNNSSLISPKHSLEIISTDKCWVLAKVDDENREVFLYPGEKIVLNYNSFLEVKLGNAGGVKLILDGKEYPLEAEAGQVKTLKFTAE